MKQPPGPAHRRAVLSSGRYPPGMSASGLAQARPAPRSIGWLQFTTFALSLLGLADSSYQTYTHYSGTTLLDCGGSSDGCVVVQHSAESVVFGIPVAVLGVAFYVFMVVVCSPWAWRSAWPAVRQVRLVSVVVGICFVLYLIYAELIEIGRICPYCTSVHIITFLLFCLIVFQFAARSPASESS
jgi:uncharacterized membrane protein